MIVEPEQILTFLINHHHLANCTRESVAASRIRRQSEIAGPLCPPCAVLPLSTDFYTLVKGAYSLASCCCPSGGALVLSCATSLAAAPVDRPGGHHALPSDLHTAEHDEHRQAKAGAARSGRH